MSLTIADLCHALPGLTAAPAAVLLALHDAKGRYLPEVAIFEAVENVTGNRGTIHAANSAIKFARKALRQHGAGIIECRALVGWRLIWNPEWSERMSDKTTKNRAGAPALNLVASVSRSEDQVILITEQGGRPVSILRMSRPHAIELAQKLIRTAR